MAILNSSGRNSSSGNDPWLELEQGDKHWDDFSPRDRENIVRFYAPKIRILALRLKAKLPQSVELNELISAGSLGLLDALGKFKAELGIKFDTYSENRIKGAMLDELRRMDWFSRGLRHKVKVLEEAMRQIEHETGSPATPEQLQDHTGMSERDVQQGLEALNNQVCLSLDSFQENILGQKNMTDDEPFQSAAFQEIVDKVANLIEELTPREKLVISLYYGEELNMKETAEVMDITEGRVSQLHSQALIKLRKTFKDRYDNE
ncbi:MULTISPECIES: FliA/WhiG family RNA polymerase sigma factor [unclassified Pseudodesulfovibrio]|uniref:FliA/WhiG family RNA polymerase sigma factor n=1 Tax=unclassified Pseudodesulfovibrio TaxID=2661612 RepID=UPI000FEBCFAC|nr:MULTISPECIES: FliA/WhiG family RNA polymerase sigma factor [unclassified Pseudodesulfovibrio]MCJ2164031.1 FliA/WhiG family RNA polymerase sigma factor [Pseudodesulfovibrio sp. S3-i]RWU05333.1 FliA/WhiG family RNA polymerase sigma factor [Pseudodesulfovibrio sp. S3]